MGDVGATPTSAVIVGVTSLDACCSAPTVGVADISVSFGAGLPTGKLPGIKPAFFLFSARLLADSLR